MAAMGRSARFLLSSRWPSAKPEKCISRLNPCWPTFGGVSALCPRFRSNFNGCGWMPRHRDALFASGDQSRVLGRKEINPQLLSRIVREVPFFRAQAACFNAQTALVAAGDRRALIVNAVPNVDGDFGSVPIISMPNIGVMACVAPILLPGEKSARLTVRSTITRWTPTRGPRVVGAVWPPAKSVSVEASQPAVSAPTAANPASPQSGAPQNAGTNSNNVPSATSRASSSSRGGGSSSCPIDLPVMPTQEFGTTLRVPLGKPVIVGSVTFAPKAAPAWARPSKTPSRSI